MSKVKTGKVKLVPTSKVKTTAQRALKFAEQLREDGTSWIDAHNKLFGAGGKISQQFRTPAERADFLNTDESARVSEILASLPRPTVPKNGNQPNGKILVRVPRSVHAALLEESEREEISLNQLILAKLCIGLQSASK